MSGEDVPAYIGRCVTCGGVFAAAVDDGLRKRDTAKFVADIIRRGGTVERTTVGWVRSSARDSWCDCGSRRIGKRKPASATPKEQT